MYSIKLLIIICIYLMSMIEVIKCCCIKNSSFSCSLWLSSAIVLKITSKHFLIKKIAIIDYNQILSIVAHFRPNQSIFDYNRSSEHHY